MLREKNIMGRRYFYPLISSFPMYRTLPTAGQVPVAAQAAEQVLCLPLYPDLAEDQVEMVCDIIKHPALTNQAMVLLST